MTGRTTYGLTERDAIEIEKDGLTGGQMDSQRTGGVTD